MTLETIYEIPKMEHDDELGGYVYPEEYRNKLVLLKDQYVYLKLNSYDSFPKFLIDMVIDAAIDQKFNGESPYVPASSPAPEFAMDTDAMTLFLETKFDEYKDQLNSAVEQLNVPHRLNSLISAKLNEHTNQALETFIDNINVRLEDMNEKIYNNSQRDFSGTNNGLSIEQVQALITKELEVVRENLPVIISQELSNQPKSQMLSGILQKQMPAVSPSIIGESIIAQPPISFEKLVVLKTAGYSIEEIAQLRNIGFI